MSDYLTELQKKKKTRFPLSRIKKVIQKNEDIGKTTVTVPVVLSKCIELLMKDLITKVTKVAEKHKSNRIQLGYLTEALNNEEDHYGFIKAALKETEDIDE